MIQTASPLLSFWLRLLVCGGPGAATAMAAAQSPGEAPPNIIVILADDLGYADLGHDGSGIDTPNIDRLAREGTKFTQFYAAAPYCSPTRAALLTGRYPQTVGVSNIISSPRKGEPPARTAARERLAHGVPTLPATLGKLGYATMLAGKWHLGYEEPVWPRSFGFDRFWGSLAGTPNYFQPVLTYENETPIQVKEYFTDAITAESVTFIRREARRPFFLLVAYNAPHCPREAPADVIAKYRRRFDEDKAGYAATIDCMDAGIGRILEALRETGIEQRTIVMFLSDNGPCPCQGPVDRARSAAPLRGHKYAVYEGGIRVPFVIRWPGRIAAGKVEPRVASVMDLFPTLLAATGRAVPGMSHHGRDILPMLTHGTTVPDTALHWHARHGYAMRSGQWKLVQNGWGSAPELFNLATDPSERRNVAEANAARVEQLTREHAEWQRRFYADAPPLASERPVWWETGVHPGFPGSK